MAMPPYKNGVRVKYIGPRGSNYPPAIHGTVVGFDPIRGHVKVWWDACPPGPSPEIPEALEKLESEGDDL